MAKQHASISMTKVLILFFHYNSSKTEAEEIFEELNSKRKNSCHILQATLMMNLLQIALQEGISKITDKLCCTYQ